MKHKSLKIFFLYVIIFVSDCKYEDGPLISFRSKAQRITALWKVEEYYVDGIDSTQLYNDSCGCYLDFAFSKPDYWKYFFWMYYCLKIDTTDKAGLPFGNWEIIDKKEILEILLDTSSFRYKTGFGPFNESDLKFEIIKLTYNKLWLKTNHDNKKYIIKLNKIKDNGIEQ